MNASMSSDRSALQAALRDPKTRKGAAQAVLSAEALELAAEAADRAEGVLRLISEALDAVDPSNDSARLLLARVRSLASVCRVLEAKLGARMAW